MSFTAAVRRADWLDAGRVSAYMQVFAAATLSFLVVWAARGLAGEHSGKPVAHDFVAFWAAGLLALQGHAADAYDAMTLRVAESSATLVPDGLLPFYYPPPALLLCAPLALLAFMTSLIVFVVGTFGVLLALLRRLVPQSWAWLPLLTWPGFLLAALIGQNTALTAACFTGAAIWLDERPILAGICLGGLVCKPQFALCVAPALLAGRRFAALLACGATASTLCGLSWFAFGTESWRNFLGHAPHAFAQIESDPVAWRKLQTVFGALRLAGANIHFAYIAQAALAAIALAALLRLVWRRPGGGLEIAALATAALLTTPYLYYYDLAVLALPAAWLARAAQGNGWRDGEKLLLLAIFVLPIAAFACSQAFGVIIAPLVIIITLAALFGRATEAGRGQSVTAPDAVGT